MLLVDLFTLLYEIITCKDWPILNIQAIERTITQFNVYIVKLLGKNDYILSLQLDIFMDNLRNVMETYYIVPETTLGSW